MNTNGGSAVVFPGQGTQKKGMGEDFFHAIPASRAVFEEASDTLGWDVGDLCFQKNDRLDLTEYAQPCIFTTEVAMFRGLQTEFGFSAEYFGGHSLGEYTALVAAGAMPFGQTLKTVQARGRLMQKTFCQNAGGMTAVIGENLEADYIRRSIAHLAVDVANINSDNQIVISGPYQALEEAQYFIQQTGGHPRFVRLNVSAPFHSRFMADIEEEFRSVLTAAEEDIDPVRARNVTANYTGNFHSDDSQTVIDNLVSQISGTVQWRKNMDCLSTKTNAVFEIGPHRPLKPFFATIDVECKSITTLTAAVRLFSNINHP